MKAVAVKQFGEPDVLEIIDMEKPKPAPDEVLIKVSGAGVNPVDGKTRRGLGFVAEAVKDSLPWIPGLDVAGTVAEVGIDVTEFKKGDRVYGMLEFLNKVGGYAEYTLAKADMLALAPEHMELLYSAGIPVAALTAWQGLFEVGDVKKDDRVLIHAAAGGVGHFAVQFAKMKEAYVICTASENNRTFLHEMGADEVIDYKKHDFTKEIEPVDFVLDNIGFEVGERSLSVLKKTGMMVTVPTITADRVKAAGDAQNKIVQGIKVKMSKDNLVQISEQIDRGSVRVFVSKIYSLSEAVRAHKDIETGRTRGKIVLGVD